MKPEDIKEFHKNIVGTIPVIDSVDELEVEIHKMLDEMKHARGNSTVLSSGFLIHSTKLKCS